MTKTLSDAVLASATLAAASIRHAVEQAEAQGLPLSPQPGEAVLSWAKPFTEVAHELGDPSQGCFYYSLLRQHRRGMGPAVGPFRTLLEALAHGQRAGVAWAAQNAKWAPVRTLLDNGAVRTGKARWTAASDRVAPSDLAAQLAKLGA